MDNNNLQQTECASYNRYDRQAQITEGIQYTMQPQRATIQGYNMLFQNSGQIQYSNQSQYRSMFCPNCGSNNLQVIQEQFTTGSEFSATQGCCGAILFGPIGILCGACGKGKQLTTNSYWLCINCGKKFKI